jgi:hypothetical protein
MTDPHGYGRLLEILKAIEHDLREDGRGTDADEVYRASRFASGSPSEFLGESRIALERLLDAGPPLQPTIEVLAREAVEGITKGFRAVGGE